MIYIFIYQNLIITIFILLFQYYITICEIFIYSIYNHFILIILILLLLFYYIAYYYKSGTYTLILFI